MRIVTDQELLDHAGSTGLQVSTAAIAGGKIKAILRGSATVDFASLLDAAAATASVTVTGAAVGDLVLGVSVSTITVDACLLSGQVTSADTVTVTLFNKKGSALDLASGTVIVYVAKL